MATNMQFGGWYNNPAQGNKNMRYWGNNYWTTGEDPTGGRGVNWQQSQPQSNTQSSTSNTSSSNINDYFEQQNKLQQSAIQPAIQSLQASIPAIQQNYQTQIGQKQASIAPLQDRYKSLIDQIKNQGQTMANKQTVVTSGELGKRGIEGSSTLAGQEIVNATQPIEQSTQSLTQQTGLAQEADVKAIQDAIANLANQQNLDVGNVNTNIANLQAGAGQSAITQALAQAQAAQAASAATKGEVTTLGGNKYLVNPYTGAKTLLGAAEASGNSLADIIKLINPNSGTTPEPKPTTSGTTTINDVPAYAQPVQESNVLGQTVSGLGPQDLVNKQPAKKTTNWWDSLFGNNFANQNIKL